MAHHQNWLSQRNLTNLPASFGKTSTCLIVNPVQPHVSWNDSTRPGVLLCSQPAVRNRCHGQDPLAARQYIDYCNNVNNTSLVAHQDTCCLHRSSYVRPAARSQLTAEKTHMNAVRMIGAEHPRVAVLNENTLTEALQIAGTGAFAKSCGCKSTNYILQPTTDSSINNLEKLRPRSRNAMALARPRSSQDYVRRWMELQEDNEGRVSDVMLISTNTAQSHGPALGQPATCRPRGGLSDSEILDANRVFSCEDDLKVAYDASRQALLAIYQAGKPDSGFHVRAPNTAALESMLAALSTGMTSPTGGQVTACVHETGRLLDQRSFHCQHVSCIRPGCSSAISHACRRVEVIPRFRTKTAIIQNETETKPVKVNLECSSNTETVINLRVRSVPA